MGSCYNCGADVFLKEEETRCTKCKTILRYWCNSCHEPFDVEDKETSKKLKECKWCAFFLCPHCQACSPDCSKYGHKAKVIGFIKGIVSIDKWPEMDLKAKQIVDYFEEVKMGRDKTTCAFGVPKTYAKERIKGILARIDGFRVKDDYDQEAFEKRREEILNKPLGKISTIGNTRDDGTYGQEYRDVFNLCVCLGKLKYEKKFFINDKKVKIGYDSWTRIDEGRCPFLDIDELILKRCPHCKMIYPRTETHCPKCIYSHGGKKHEKGSHFELTEILSNNPTCRNLSQFKKGEAKEDGESKFKGDN